MLLYIYVNAHNITNGTIINVIFTKKYNKVVKLTVTYFYFRCLLSHIGWAFVGVALVGVAFVGGGGLLSCLRPCTVYLPKNLLIM